MDTKIKAIVHEEHVGGSGYDKSLYQSKRLWATGVDGTAIPMSVVYRKDLLNTESGNLLLLHAYGAYGCCIDPIFSATRLSLLDRGFIFAIAQPTPNYVFREEVKDGVFVLVPAIFQHLLNN